MFAFDLGPKFSLGSVYITANAQTKISTEDAQKALSRHMRGDWGVVDARDKAENERCVHASCRLLSAYVSVNGVKFWIITEADRSSTTILLPEDY